MTPTDIVSLAKVLLEIGLAVFEAVRAHGGKAQDLKLSDVLPAKLLTTVQKEAADAKARERFGTDGETVPQNPFG